MTQVREMGNAAAPTRQSKRLPASLDPEMDLVTQGRHHDPHSVLGRHGDVVRALRPGATSMFVLSGSPDHRQRTEMHQLHPSGIWEGKLDPSASSYQLEALYGTGSSSPGFVFDDPYRFWPTIGDLDLHLFGEGRHLRLWEMMGAHYRSHGGIEGTAFAVWAPNAKAVRVVGDWNFWDGRVHPMRSLGSSGVWELFVPGVVPGAHYKFEIVTADGRLVLKADPMAEATEEPPGTASVISQPSVHRWNDGPWLRRRSEGDPLARPVSIYEMHIGSWRFTDDGYGGSRPLTYLELADQLPAYLEEMGFTHVEFMPVAEHPFGGSWGYQVTSYYAPSARFGSPDDFKALVDALHRKGIGVIVDWVPAHFPKDDFALARFDGTSLYEHEDPRLGAHPDWGTLVFNLGRNEVRNFLLANALYWVENFHIDGLRVDAVASMLYLDYSRNPGEWIPNRFGGRENIEAVEFLKEVNERVFSLYPGATTIAEESTAWPAVSRPTYVGGLGFGFKWNMGWMHDTLQYFTVDPLFRRYHQHDLTFGLIYAWHENFVLPLSHDEVVHGKRSLLNKMPGDRWQQLANLRALYGWMFAHPGKQLLFMGSEFGQESEWRHDCPLDWWTLQWADHSKLQAMVAELNHLYRSQPALWEADFSSEGFSWIDASDADHNVISFLRKRASHVERSESSPSWPVESTGVPSETVVCVANLSPDPKHAYRIGVPKPGRWLELLNTDATEWGGSGLGNAGEVWADDRSWHGQSASVELVLPPLSVTWFSHISE